jgi:hypothetical protein
MSNLIWLGRVLSSIVVLALVADAAVIVGARDLVAADMAITGFPPALAPILGVVILVSALLYAVPQTAVLGAVLVTGFLGGAVCMHFRLGEIGSPPQVVAVLIGLFAWAGLYLRNPRVRTLLPLVTH